MLMGDDGLDNFMERDGSNNLMDYSYGGGDNLISQNDEESIAKSYNQKVKNDTNFLAKSKAMLGDGKFKGDEAYTFKKEQEILYNLQLRCSYKNMSSNKYNTT